MVVEKPHSKPASNQRWIMLGIVAFASAAAYLTRHCIAAANTTIQQDLGFDDAEMGKLMSAFGFGYLICQVPAGWLGNRLGTRFTFAFLSTFWSLCNVWTAISHAFRWMWLSRFSLGLFQAGLTPVSAKILKDWIPLPARGKSSALITACMSLGGAFAMWLTGRLLDRGSSWQTLFLAYSSVGIVWAVGFFWYFRTYPAEHKNVNRAELDLLARASGAEDADSKRSDEASVTRKPDRKRTAQLALNIVRHPGIWGLSIQAFFRAAGYSFFVTWFFAFLEYAYEIEKEEAGLLNSLPLIAVVIGCLTGGLVVDGLLKLTGSRRLSRTGTAFISLTLSGLFTMASTWTTTATQLSVVIAIGAFFSGIGSPAAWVATIDIGRRHTAVAMGTMNMAGCCAGIVLPMVLGNWFKQIREHGGNWDLVVYLHAAFYFAGALSWLLVNPNRGIRE